VDWEGCDKGLQRTCVIDFVFEQHACDGVVDVAWWVVCVIGGEVVVVIEAAGLNGEH
jgi:hypothetical protein